MFDTDDSAVAALRRALKEMNDALRGAGERGLTVEVRSVDERIFAGSQITRLEMSAFRRTRVL